MHIGCATYGNANLAITRFQLPLPRRSGGSQSPRPQSDSDARTASSNLRNGRIFAVLLGSLFRLTRQKNPLPKAVLFLPPRKCYLAVGTNFAELRECPIEEYPNEITSPSISGDRQPDHKDAASAGRASSASGRCGAGQSTVWEARIRFRPRRAIAALLELGT